MSRKCAVCGTETTHPPFSGVILCEQHYTEISTQVNSLRAEGKQVNAAGMARKMYRKRYTPSDHILRDVPRELWDKAKHLAINEGISIRELILTAISKYIGD
jgi:hypothetical protein